MIGVSGGIEPIFANYYTRKTESLDKEVTYYKVYTKIVKEYMDENGITDDSELPEYFVTSPEIPYEKRVRMQSIWQSHIDASISSTVNLSNSATPVDVYNIYMAAYEEGLKGITVFRDGCERAGILTTDNVKKNDAKEENTTTEPKYEIFPRGVIERVPPDLDYRKYKLKTGCGNLYLFIGIDEYDGKIYDIFTNTDGVGGCTVNTQAVSRLISACLRSGTPIEYIIEQLNKTGTCPSFQFHRGKGEKLCNGKSCPSAIANILKDIVKEFEDIDTETEIPRMPVKTVYSDEVNVVKEVKEDNKSSNSMVCQECGNKLVAESGCVVCKNCGWSKCE